MYLFEEEDRYTNSFVKDRFDTISTKIFDNSKEALEKILINLYTKNPKINEKELEENFSYLCDVFEISDSVLSNGISIKK